MIKQIRKAFWWSKIVSTALIFSLLSAFYWIVIASDRYVSEAHVFIQKTDLPGGQSMDFAGLLTGIDSGNRADQLLLRDHLQSIDMLRRLDEELGLRAHYSDSAHDLLSRMWFQDSSIEMFHRYYLSRVHVEFDDYSGLLIIKAQAYDAQMAQRITTALVQEGERFMNQLAHELAQAQVNFLNQQVIQMNERVLQTRSAVLEFQNKKGLVSPQATTENISAIIARLEAQRSDLQTQRAGLQAYLVPDHPSIVMLNQQITAVERQITQEQAKLASPVGKALNSTVEQFQRLELEAAFAQDVYKTALVALEKGRVEATRTIKKVSIMQTPSLPEYSLEPLRYYNTLISLLAAMVLAGVAHLLVAIVRDHTD